MALATPEPALREAALGLILQEGFEVGDKQCANCQRFQKVAALCCCLSAPAAAGHVDQISPWAETLTSRSHEFSLLPDAAVKSGPDWVGLGRDTAFLSGYQAAVAGVIYLLPEEISGWSDREKSRGLDNWVRNVSRPELDKDSWEINYIGHPYFGATYYLRARERGFGGFSSFVYSALASAAYEFGVEAFFEKPSIQDLVVTPVGGALLGAFVFEPIRNRIKAKPVPAWYDHLGLILTDPVGALNGMSEGLFGIKSDIHVNLKLPRVTRSPERTGSLRDRAIGLELSIRWD
jgi:hypothetical protein